MVWQIAKLSRLAGNASAAPVGGSLTQVQLLHAQLMEHALEHPAGLVDIVRVSTLAPLVREVDLLAVRGLLDRLTDVLGVLYSS